MEKKNILKMAKKVAEILTSENMLYIYSGITAVWIFINFLDQL